MKSGILAVMLDFVAGDAQAAQAQSILFNFDAAPLYAPLPIELSAGGVTARLSATGQGYSIQSAATAPVVPAGFTGQFIYPSGISASDLLIAFSVPLAVFSIQYAPQELACDSSATMRVSAYWNNTEVGTATTNAVPGTWPVETLAIYPLQQFNNVVVHYDKVPVTGGDYGTIFIADNMSITPAPPSLVLEQAVRLADGSFQFSCTNSPGSTFTILAASDLDLPLASWIVLGASTETAPGQYQFADTLAGSASRRFYRVRSP